MQTVLLIEDDSRLAGLIKDFLESHQYVVFVEPSGFGIKRKVKNLHPDIIILDIMLPGKNGLEICKEIRPEYSGPILMQTARDSDADQILGFDNGADDYIIKPVDPKILIARIKALLRRYNKNAPQDIDTFHYGQLNISTLSREVLFNNSPVTLPNLEFELLLILCRRADEILSREYLFKTLYGREYDGTDRSIDVRISQLRKRFNDDIDKPNRIKTIWGKGYMLASNAWHL